MQRPSDEILDFFSNVLTIRNQLETDLTSPPTRESSRRVTLQLNDLHDLLSSTVDLETKCDRRLINFILATLMPVLQWIKNTPRQHHHQQQQLRYNNVIEAWLKCINIFLSRTYWTIESPPQLLEQLIILFTNFMIHATKTEEEIQHLAVQCMKTTVSKLTDDSNLTQTLRDLKFRPQMAGSISALLDIIRKGDALQLRIDAMHTLSTLVLDALGQVDSVAVFLPGIASALGRTIYQKQEKENQQVLSTALDVLGNVIVFVMQDECAPDFIVHKINSLHDLLSTTSKHRNNDNTNIKNDKGKGKEIQAVAINETEEFVQNFYTTTKKKIKDQLDFILAIKSYNTDWRVRRVMVRFAGKLLIKCSQTLDNCTSLLLKTVVLFIDDEYIQVATEAQLQIRDIMQVPVLEQTIIPTLKENLADSITTIPKILISGDEGDKVTAMALVTGYILILGNRHAQGVLDSIITKTLDGWLAAFQIDQGGLNVLDENRQNSNKFIEFQEGQKQKESPKGHDSTNTTTGSEQQQQESSPIYPKVRFKYLVADRTAAQAGRMLNVIGRYGSLSFWLDILMDCFREQELDIQPQAAYMIHSLLSGASAEEIDTIDPQWFSYRTIDEPEETSNIKTIALHVLHEIILLIIDPVITTVDHTTSVAVPGGRQFDRLKKELETAEVLATCFGLQIVGLVASILEAESIQDELITLLYPLLAHLGSPNVFIHTYALITLDAIALVCNKQGGGGGARQLAVENIDYIINMVSQRISVLEDNLRAPLVLKALIRIGGPGTIDYLEDTVEEIFDALDGYHMDDWSCAQLCSVLAEIVRVVYRNNTISLETVNEHDNSAKQQDQTESMDKQEHKISNEIHNFIKSNTTNKKEVDDDTVNKVPKSMEEIGRYFLDQREKKSKRSDSFDPTHLIPGYEDINNEEDEEIKPPDDTPEPLSRAQQMTLDIMNKSRHFLTASSPQLRVEMLGLFSAGTKVLAFRLDKLGVLVNEAWPHIIQRLSDKESNMVILEAVTIIGSIAESLHDFISNRVKDFWPRFKELLKRGRNESYHYSAYSYVHRLHNAILVTLKSVIEHCAVRATQIPEMMNEIKWYLDERLHVELQQSGIHVFNAMSKRYPDTVWLYMLSMVSHEESTIVDETGRFDTFVIPEWMKVKEPYYRRNARHILSLVPAQ